MAQTTTTKPSLTSKKTSLSASYKQFCPTKACQKTQFTTAQTRAALPPTPSLIYRNNPTLKTKKEKNSQKKAKHYFCFCSLINSDLEILARVTLP
jgi:hypothetical protein